MGVRHFGAQLQHRIQGRRERLCRGKYVCSWRASNAELGKKAWERGGISDTLRGEVTSLRTPVVLFPLLQIWQICFPKQLV